MYRKMVVALIIAGLLVTGYGIFADSTAQAAAPCDGNSMVDNPELLKVTCSEVTPDEINVQRANAANAARYTGLAAHYLADNPGLMIVQRANEANAARYTGLAAHYLADNPELMAVQRANAANAARYTGLAAYFTANPELMVASR